MSLINYHFVKTVQATVDHELFALEPEHTFASHGIILNDELPSVLLSGKIKLKCGIDRLTESAILFEDGTTENDIDTIIYATGYKYEFPFLKQPAFEVTENQSRLYKYVFPPDIADPPTIAAIGYINVLGSAINSAEIQSRWAVAVFKVRINSLFIHFLCNSTELCMPWTLHTMVNSRLDSNVIWLVSSYIQ